MAFTHRGARPINETPPNALNKAKKHLGGRPANRGGVTPRDRLDGGIHPDSGGSGLAYSAGAALFPPVDRSHNNRSRAACASLNRHKAS